MASGDAQRAAWVKRREANPRRFDTQGDLILRELVATVDDRTTVVCLHAAGQIRRADEPFDTIAGQFMDPPFHIACRSLVRPWMAGMVDRQRSEANAELMERPLAQRRIGPDGEIGGRVPPPAQGNPPGGGRGRPAPVAPGGVHPIVPDVPVLRALSDAQKALLVDRRLAETVRQEFRATPEGRFLSDTIDQFQGTVTSARRFRGSVAKYLAGGELSPLTAQRVEVILGAIRSAPTAPAVLYRGIAVRGGIDAVLARYAEQTHLDLGLSSFTSDAKVAARFANQATYGVAAPTTRIMVELLGDDATRALPVSRIGKDIGYEQMREFITGGRFEIVEVKKAAGRLLLRLRQVETL